MEGNDSQSHLTKTTVPASKNQGGVKGRGIEGWEYWNAGPREGEMMSLTRCSLVIALALAVSGGGQFLSAQRGLGGGGLGLYGVGPRLGENVQLALDYQEQLGLSAEQVASLRDLVTGIQADVEPVESQIDALRAQLLAGEVEWGAGIYQLQELRIHYQAMADPYRAGVAAVLDADQHLALQAMMFETWPLVGEAWGGAPLGLGGTGPGLSQSAGRLPAVGSGWNSPVGIGRGGGRGLGWGVGRGAGWGIRRGLGRGSGWSRAGFYRRGIGW